MIEVKALSDAMVKMQQQFSDLDITARKLKLATELYDSGHINESDFRRLVNESNAPECGIENCECESEPPAKPMKIVPNPIFGLTKDDG